MLGYDIGVCIIYGPGYCGKDADNSFDPCEIYREKSSMCLTLLHFSDMCR